MIYAGLRAHSNEDFVCNAKVVHIRSTRYECFNFRHANVCGTPCDGEGLLVSKTVTHHSFVGTNISLRQLEVPKL